jgi:DNA invertase Pin-like site-specific DNA recombinase
MFRFATFAAVSSDEQVKSKNKVTGKVDEKYSLDNQVQECRAYGTSLGGQESAGPFIADGYSRSAYEGLPDAMADIPALKEAVEAAGHNQYDVLFVRYFDRLGSTAEMVFTRFKKLKKQLRSVQEATPIMPPELYDPLKDDSTMTQIKIAGIYQEGRINRMVSNTKENMPKRIRAGLTPGRVPYGYRYTSNRTPPEQVPERIAKLLSARDMLMNGESLSTIGTFLGVDRSRVPTVLGNPYYAGQVSYNKTFTRVEGKKRVAVPQPSSKWTVGKGQHKPVWTEQEHADIVSELARREGKYRPSDFVFYGIIHCGVCGQRARWHIFGTPPKARRVITCRKHYSKHILFEYDDFTLKAIIAIQDEIRKMQSGEVGEGVDNREEAYRKAIGEKQKKRRKVQEGFENDLYSAAEAGKLLRELDKETVQLERDIERVQREKQARRDALSAMREFGDDAREFPRMLSRRTDTKRVNRLLAAWIRELTLEPDGEIKVVLR